MLYDSVPLALSELICGLILIGGTLNPTVLRKITDQMDALNTALLWTNQLCSANPEPIKTDLTELRYAQCCDLLNNYAYPYSVICSGYISYSRHRFSAEIDGNVIIFNPCKDQNESMWSDIIRANSEVNLAGLESGFESYKFLDALNEFRRRVTIDNGYICYSLSERIISAFKEIALQQWNITKTLPENWTFDTFSLNEYKDFWVTLAALCYIHFCSCLTISNPAIRLRNCTIIQSEDELINYIEANSRLTAKKVQTIIRYITYDATKRNADIMYQPKIDSACDCEPSNQLCPNGFPSAILGRKNNCICACLIFISEYRGDDNAHDQRNQQEYRWKITGQQRFPSVRIIVCDRVRYFCIQL